MAQVTVQQLAEVVGASSERLLTQMKEAGLPHSAADEPVSDEDKQTLLKFLKRTHGESTDAPKRITLKRKTLSTLRTPGAQGKKTVNVEVRKKRTYVKRDAEEMEEPEISEEEEVVAQEEAAPVEEVAVEPVPELEPEDEANLDPEVLRQRAAARRKLEEENAAASRAAAAEARKLAEEQAKAAAVTKDSGKEGTKRPKRLHELPSSPPKDEDRRKPRGKLARNAPAGRGKQRSHNLSLADIESETGITRRRGGRKKLKAPHAEHGKHGFELPTERKIIEVELTDAVSVADLAQSMFVKSGEVIKELMKLGVMANINQVIDQDTATLVVEELGHKVKLVSTDAVEESLEETLSQHEGVQEPRAPVVTVMGHVDHGKTSLLDYIRKSQVAEGEAGGITQHIGAYHVDTDHGMISFLDTPGHAAFTAMRARGAEESTDIVILVVAADDGVMPQTEEAVTHAQAAEVPIIVAVNKIDKEGADLEKIKGELAAKDVVPEDWGGDVQFIPVSAHTGEGISELLDAVLLQAELLELQAARDVPAQGIVIESRLDKGRGPVASLLVQSGTLRRGDIVLAGLQFGRVRAMLDENGQPIDSAGPSIPVEILGLDATPGAGDLFAVVESEKRAREVADFRQEKSRDKKLQQQATTLDTMFESMTAVGKQSLNVVVKADVRGSLEAIQSALLEIGNEEVQVNIVSGGVGGITETDINLAVTSNAVVFGFNVRADNAARSVVENEGIDLRYYKVIYDLIDDVKAALTGMLAPELREEIVGIAEVLDVFRSPKFGQIAGCRVSEGAVYRGKPIRVLRDNIVIYEGELESLRRHKDDVNEVRSGTECGIGVKNYTDVKVGDLIEVFEVKEIARSL